jgi:glycine dehydrogenase subunit 2
MLEPLLFNLSADDREGYSLPELDVPEIPINDVLPERFQRKDPLLLPELHELDIMRHFVHLSSLNHHVDKGLYPLGSCTMKYNPKINENLSRLAGFSELHPFEESADTEGALQIMGELMTDLCAISGMCGITLQPAAGAHGEMTGIKIIRAYHEDQGNPRHKILLPDSAHGTNPASATISGYTTLQVKSTENGLVDIDELKAHLDNDVACLMLTNPNTLGLFESDILKISEIVHDAGALMYMDGANLNALLGIVRPGDIGFDVVHFNLHKTFSTPHGGGGPGSGPVGVKPFLSPYLPTPVIIEEEGNYNFDYNRPKSIGKIHGFWGNFGIMVRAYVYIRMLGAEGLKRVSEGAILNANYLMRQLEKSYDLPYKQHAMHEFVLSGDRQKALGVKTLDIAKRLLDYGFHAPTVYFPLIVHEALMIEPTETESKETLDKFVDAMLRIAKEVEESPEQVQKAPSNTPVSRLDEGLAARLLNVRHDMTHAEEE